MQSLQRLLADHDFSPKTKRKVYWGIGLLTVLGIAAAFLLPRGFPFAKQGLILGPTAALLYLFVRGPSVFLCMFAILIPLVLQREGSIRDDQNWIIFASAGCGLLLAAWANWEKIDAYFARTREREWNEKKREARKRKKRA
ncbi:MAG TPA: hypothetical protein VMM36_01200 [Opitutaceae bacterium]|nr:hypothetical protein [Opitutaceae bacterium]